MLLQSALVALGATLAAAVQPMEVEGNYFVNPSTGNRFQIVGVAYQPGGSAGYKPDQGKDPLSNGDICMRDAALMQILGVNTIRVYNLDPNLNHDECASIFNAAGMYMIIDVNSPLVGESITTYHPWESYYAAYLNRTFAVVEAFKNYPNTLAFFSGNEVIFSVDAGADVPPYMRAVTRDLKNYIKKHSDRTIPVGYSAADVRDILFDSYEYLQCAEDGDADDMSRGDLFALNSYSWCGDSSFTTSSYDDLVEGFKDSSLPIFFSEYGCNKPSPRVFTEVPVIYGSQMNGVLSGGVVYEYAQEENNYGLADLHDEDDGDHSVDLLADFLALQKQYASLDWTVVQGASPPSGDSPKPPKCDSSLIKTKTFTKNFTIPVLPPGAQEIIDDGVNPKPSGKIIDISDYSVKYEVRNPDGTILSDLAVKPLSDDEINSPGSNTATATGTPTGTGTSSTASSTSSEDAAPGRMPISFGIPIAVIVTVLLGNAAGFLVLFQ